MIYIVALGDDFNPIKIHWTQCAEARCYPQKRCLGFDFRFKTFMIKQAIFINDIFPSRVEAQKRKKIEVFFTVFLGLFKIFARLSAFFKI